jgi:hypothetical protein
MTPAEQAKRAVKAWTRPGDATRLPVEQLHNIIALEIEVAVAAERRACARIAKAEAWRAYEDSKAPDAVSIEKQIRARGHKRKPAKGRAQHDAGRPGR